ncbi:acyltransferase family protein [Mucilaginibacter lappiensis]|uniref:Peptidoglycan/LPS O-acetylase OafA/YrhL n=1 Tax=Mucilaginibacter lappiensis TaxID=354630 RepID=A0A841JEI1_9SPHI|nr:acyltransferase [Mucilaginibacter lappiensis]MBB6128974.1 peptidoglycan/LPS O-acetylase OafA/YrhL [Mucilaginibacter lappiensis]
MPQNQLNPDILKTKQHFEVLDGLRGVAALAIVLYHFLQVNYASNFLEHGFLAVDFFFCLSGFVIGYAYDNRIQKMGIMEFFKLRIIRLHPLVVFGSVLGLLAYLFNPYSGNHTELYGTGKLILLFVSSILLIPLPLRYDHSFPLFLFNVPAWSLFWEYVANIAYAFILCRIGQRLLILLTIVAAIFIYQVAYHSGTLIGGWGLDTLWDGCARICYSFSAGLLVYRSKWIIKNKLGFIGMALLLVLAFTMPFSKGYRLVQVLSVLIYFPLLITLGAGAILTPALKKFCIFLGKISYPLYMTHYTVMWIFADYYSSHKPGPGLFTLIVTISTILLVGVAYLTMKIYDIPVRRYLSNKRKSDI